MFHASVKKLRNGFKSVQGGSVESPHQATTSSLSATDDGPEVGRTTKSSPVRRIENGNENGNGNGGDSASSTTTAHCTSLTATASSSPPSAPRTSASAPRAVRSVQSLPTRTPPPPLRDSAASCPFPVKDPLAPLRLGVPVPEDPTLLPLHARVGELMTTLEGLNDRSAPSLLLLVHNELQKLDALFMGELAKEVRALKSTVRLRWLVDKAVRCFYNLSEEFYESLVSNRTSKNVSSNALKETAPYLSLKSALSRQLFVEAGNLAYGHRATAFAKDVNPSNTTHPAVFTWMKEGGPASLIASLLACLVEQDDSTLVWYTSHLNSRRQAGPPLLTFAYVLNRSSTHPITVMRLRVSSTAHEEDSVGLWLEEIRRERLSQAGVSPATLEGYKLHVRSKYDLLVRPLESDLPPPFASERSVLYVVDTRHAPTPNLGNTYACPGQARWLAGYMDRHGLLATEKWAIATAPEVWTVAQYSWHRRRALVGSLSTRKAFLSHRDPFSSKEKPLVSRNCDFGEEAEASFLRCFDGAFASKRLVCMADLVRRSNLSGVCLEQEPWRAVHFTVSCYGGLLCTSALARSETPAEAAAHANESYFQTYGINGLLDGMVADVVVQRPDTEATLVDRLLLYLRKHELPLRTMVAGACQTKRESPAIMLPPRSTPRKNFTPLQLVHFMQMRPVAYKDVRGENPWDTFFQQLLSTPTPGATNGEHWRPERVTFWAPRRITQLAFEPGAPPPPVDDSDNEVDTEEMVLFSFLPTFAGEKDSNARQTKGPVSTTEELPNAARSTTSAAEEVAAAPKMPSALSGGALVAPIAQHAPAVPKPRSEEDGYGLLQDAEVVPPRSTNGDSSAYEELLADFFYEQYNLPKPDLSRTPLSDGDSVLSPMSPRPVVVSTPVTLPSAPRTGSRQCPVDRRYPAMTDLAEWGSSHIGEGQSDGAATTGDIRDGLRMFPPRLEDTPGPPLPQQQQQQQKEQLPRDSWRGLSPTYLSNRGLDNAYENYAEHFESSNMSDYSSPLLLRATLKTWPSPKSSEKSAKNVVGDFPVSGSSSTGVTINQSKPLADSGDCHLRRYRTAHKNKAGVLSPAGSDANRLGGTRFIDGDNTSEAVTPNSLESTSSSKSTFSGRNETYQFGAPPARPKEATTVSPLWKGMSLRCNAPECMQDAEEALENYAPMQSSSTLEDFWEPPF